MLLFLIEVKAPTLIPNDLQSHMRYNVRVLPQVIFPNDDQKIIDPKNNEYPMISPIHSLLFWDVYFGLSHEFTMSFRPFLFLYSLLKLDSLSKLSQIYSVFTINYF